MVTEIATVAVGEKIASTNSMFDSLENVVIAALAVVVAFVAWASFIETNLPKKAS